MRILFPLLTLFFQNVFFNVFAHATNPSFRWEVLETKHFEVIYHRPQKELAKKYAFAAEESHRILSQVFSDLPSKTVIVLDDSTDLTNGSATFLPYDWIVIYPALPNPGESLDDYGFWPTSITIHELTHIANFQPASGFYTPLLYLMGRIVTPNTLLPRWYLEGLAVDTESRYTAHGRLRSSRTQGILRALSLENRWKKFGVDQINETLTPTWPFGERPYFFGSLLKKRLVDQGSTDLRERWNQRFGRRVPFLIDSVPRDDFNKNFNQLLFETYNDLEEKARISLEEIRKNGETEWTPFKSVDHEQTEPSVSPDGKKLIYLSRSYRRSAVRLLEKSADTNSFAKAEPKHLFNVSSPLKLEWDSDSQGFYFDEVDMDTPFISYRRIYHYDLQSGKKHPLLGSLRAQEPSLSPDQSKMAVITTLENGQQALSFISMADKNVHTLYIAPLQERLSRPVFSSNESILFLRRDLKGQDHLLEWNFYSTEVSAKQSPFKNLRLLKPHRDQWLFLSSESGVDNLYSTVSFQENTAVTNTATWIHSFEAYATEENQLMVVSQMTGEGLKFFETPRKEFSLSKSSPLVDYADRPEDRLPTTAEENSVVLKEKNFYPFKYLLPTYWIPFVYPLDGGVIVQGSTSGTDPIGINQYLLSGSYDTLTRGSSYGMAYLNSSFPVRFSANAAKFQEYLGASAVNFEKTTLGATAFAPLSSFSQRWNLGGGYSKSTSTLRANRDQREGPEVFINHTSLLDRRFSEHGSVFALSFQKFMAGPQLIEYERLSFSLGKKNALPFKGDHSLWFGIKGAFSNRLPMGDVFNFGDRSLGANYLVNLTESQFLYRGYPSGSLVGRQLLNSNLEYRFPINELFYGNEVTPLFFRTLTGVAFVDALAVDGYYYDLKLEQPVYRRTPLSEAHLSTGAEIRLDTTLAYHLPITFILGGYYGLSRQMGENFSVFIGIGGRDPLSELSHRKLSHGF